MKISNVNDVFCLNGNIGYFEGLNVHYEKKILPILSQSNIDNIGKKVLGGNLFIVDKGDILRADFENEVFIKVFSKEIAFEETSYEIIDSSPLTFIEYNFDFNKLEIETIVNFYIDFVIESSIKTLGINKFKMFHGYLTSYETIKNTLTAYNSMSGVKLWEFDFKEFAAYKDFEGTHEGKITSEIIECKGVLIMQVSTPRIVGSINKIVGIDLVSGICLWTKEYPIEVGSKCIVFNNELFVLSVNFEKLDAKTGNVICSYFPFAKTVKRYNNIILNDKYIFVTDSSTNVYQLSRKSGEIIWQTQLYSLEKDGRKAKGISTRQEPIQYCNGTLYVLDRGDILHVFENLDVE